MQSYPKIGLINNKIYEVISTEYCCQQSIDVGIVHNDAFTRCSYCGTIINIDERHFLSHEGFRPLLPSEERKLEIEANAEAFNLTLRRDHRCY
jgi:hypothetical protein